MELGTGEPLEVAQVPYSRLFVQPECGNRQRDVRLEAPGCLGGFALRIPLGSPQPWK